MSNKAVYAVKHINEETRASSRSGGIFTALSDYVLKNNGVIYGCVLNEDFEAVHIRADNESERNRMRGSKYIQSNMQNSFADAKKDLEKGILVLFSGTPCQISGLKAFLNKSYDNLICINIVCHGVPSYKVLKSYIEWQESKNGGKCVNIDFRNKEKFGWAAHIETLLMKNDAGACEELDSTVFCQLFVNHDVLRPSCYKCPYKNTDLPGDITIADYWGIDNAAPGFNDNKGVSLVLINTDKGEKLFDLIRPDIVYKKCRIEDSLQPSLVRPEPRPKSRNSFWRLYRKRPFDYVVKKYTGRGYMYRIRKKLRKIIGFI